MKLNSISKKMVTLTVVGVISLVGTGTAFAGVQNSSQAFNAQAGNQRTVQGVSQGANQDRMSFNNNDGQNKQFRMNMQNQSTGQVQPMTQKNPMSELVSEGAINQTQLNAVKEAMGTAKDEGTSLSDILATLVSAGTITQDQADAILESIPARSANCTTASGITATQQQDPMSELVTDGTLTQDELDAVKEALDAAKDSDSTLSDVLDALVEDETITDDQAEAILASMPAKTAFETANDEQHNPLASLVTAGTLTDDELEAVEAALADAKDSDSTLSDVLDALVEDETITNDQADAILDALVIPTESEE